MQITEADIIQGCKRYEKTAQALLFRRYSPILKGICFRYMGWSDSTDDLLQEGFLKIFLGIHKYDGKGSFEGWIKRVFVNYIIDCQRKNRRAKQEVVEADAEMYPELSNDNHSQDEDVFDIIEYASGVLTREDIMHSIAGLPEVFRIVFNLFHIEELDHKEIAELLGIETTTSRTRLARARKLLKDNLLTCMEEKTGEKVNYARG